MFYAVHHLLEYPDPKQVVILFCYGGDYVALPFGKWLGAIHILL